MSVLRSDLMRWSDFKNEPGLTRIIKFATLIGIFISASGVVWEVWDVLQVTQTRLRAAAEAIDTGLQTRVLFWLAIGILAQWILIIFGTLFLRFMTRTQKNRT